MSRRNRIWCHLHLPKFKAGNPECVSITQPGKTVRYAQFVEMRDVEFVVQEGGRLRSLREGRKNVHAYVTGLEIEMGSAEVTANSCAWRIAKYNPTKGPNFYDKATGEPLTRAAFAFLNEDTVLYIAYPEA